ncbi:MAG: hypothetical protein ABJ360_05650 [Roseobacter sp.]
MSEIVVIEYQLWILAGSVILGVFTTSFLFVASRSRRTWQYVDLIWIVIGGLSAVVAFGLSLYLSDASDTQRSIDIFKAQASNLNSDASMFLERNCSSSSERRLSGFYDQAFDSACDATRFIVQETDEQSQTYKFVGLLENDPTNFKEAMNEEWGSPGFFQKIPAIESGVSSGVLLPGRKTYLRLNIDSPDYHDAAIQVIRSGIYKDFGLEFLVFGSNSFNWMNSSIN